MYSKQNANTFLRKMDSTGFDSSRQTLDIKKKKTLEKLANLLKILDIHHKWKYLILRTPIE